MVARTLDARPRVPQRVGREEGRRCCFDKLFKRFCVLRPRMRPGWSHRVLGLILGQMITTFVFFSGVIFVRKPKFRIYLSFETNPYLM